MRFVLATAAVALPLLSLGARADPLQHARHMQHARQAPPPPASSRTPVGTGTGTPAAPAPPGATASGSTSVSAPAGSAPASGNAPAPPSGTAPAGAPSLTTGAAPTFPSVSFSLHATNPTAVPLSSIIANAPSALTSPLAATPTAGTVPPQISNAPPIPDISGFNPANYPPLDKIPDVNSPQVQQWVSEVMNSGIPIPNITQTVPGGCPANLQAAADMGRCWWTCGGCTRPTDIEVCPEKMHWGLTYDDGPAFYTSQLLDYLDEKQLKSTFFCVGSRVASFPNTLRQEYISGHQVAVHTWSHPSLTTLSNEQIIAELGWTKKVMKDVLGVTPNMMRPPFGDIDDRVRAISLAMGLIPAMWTRISPTATFDTDDFNIQGGLTSAAQVLQNWEFIMGNATAIDTGFIVLEHDLFQDTVEIATGYILPDAIARGGLTIEPIAMCVDRGLSNSYIETNDNKTFPPPQGSGTVIKPSDLLTVTNPSVTAVGALNSSTTSSGGSSGDNNGAIGSLHISGGVVAFTILAGILANVLTVF